MSPVDEKYCLKELAGGNRQAFEWLFVTWHPKLVSFFVRLLGEGDTAYDYAQDIFFDIWKCRRKFSEVESFSAYLFQMARFKVYNHFDKAAVKSRYSSDIQRTGAAGPVSAEPEIFAAEMQKLVWDAVGQLPEKRRKVFIMSRLQGYSNEEIAAALGINKRTVENHITSVLATLRGVVK